MRYGVMLNMDYEHYPRGAVLAVFQSIKSALEEKGFRQDGRAFTIGLPPGEACDLARGALEEAAARHDEEVYAYVKEFYGFDVSKATNLLVPGGMEIDVTELEGIELGNLGS